MKRNRSIAFALCLVLLFAFVGCAGLQDTPQSKYLKARMEFNNMYESYLGYYDKADVATQAKWKENIDPKFKKASKVLNLWGLAVAGKLTSLIVERQRDFLAMKNELIDILAEKLK